jgi:hypothetical protein
MPLHVYVITHGTKDYGDKFVVRRQTMVDGDLLPDALPLAVEDKLDLARAHVPTESRSRRFPAHSHDDPVIKEWWM